MLATAVVDTLAKAPTNEVVALAGKLARSEQLLVGVPASRLDVDAILAGEKSATDSLLARLKLVAPGATLAHVPRLTKSRFQDCAIFKGRGNITMTS